MLYETEIDVKFFKNSILSTRPRPENHCATTQFDAQTGSTKHEDAPSEDVNERRLVVEPSGTGLN